MGELARERAIESGALDNGDLENNMTCYKGGETVFRSYQMCDVTSAYRLSRYTFSEEFHTLSSEL